MKKIEKGSLRDEFIEPPFSVLDSKNGYWQQRKKEWKKLGIKSEIGRNMKGMKTSQRAGDIDYLRKKKIDDKTQYISIFDPVLCELMYHWFCPKRGKILDPFAGGSVRGIVANFMKRHYLGIELRQEQVDSNRQQAKEIITKNKFKLKWICGDSKRVLKGCENEIFDMIFTCPPYGNLEVYSSLEGDISNMDYENFLINYKKIIKLSLDKLKEGRFAVFVVGEFRDKKTGNYVGFVSDTIKIFQGLGMDLYNEAVFLTPIASASMRARGNMKTRKLVKVHQNVLIFLKRRKEKL